jgi:signal transduction histidine kinase/CheY-like chemotaxis protein
MLEFSRNLFHGNDLSPQGLCLLWRPELVWTYVISDAIIGISSVSVTIALCYFLSHRRDIVFPGVFGCLAVFLAYSTTHFMSIWTLWVPSYGLEAIVKVATAITSMTTACILWWLMPTALNLPSRSLLRTVNASLEDSLIEKGNAESASEAKTQFLARMTHEIRTPLTSIVGYTELLLKQKEHSLETEKRLEIVRKAGNALMTIVDNVLDFSAIQVSHLNLNESIFDLNLLCNDSIDMLLPVASKKALSLVKSCRSPKPVFLIGDEFRIRQILLNLLNNAIKFTLRGYVELNLTCEIGKDDIWHIRLEVRDSGIGIAPNQLHKLFQPFSQIDNSSTRQFGGVGLGLSICKLIVDAMQGEIGYLPNEGGGSVFWVRLSLPKAQTSRAKPTEVRLIDGSGNRILLVDDVLINRHLIQAILENSGYDVDVATDGIEAVDMFDLKDYKLVLIGMRTSKMDGITAIMKIRSSGMSNNTIPIIVIIARANLDQASSYLQSDVNDIIGAPFTTQILIETVSRWLPVAARLGDKPVLDGVVREGEAIS